MRAKRTNSLHRSLCAVLALFMVLTTLPWITPTWASAQEVDGTVLHSEDFENAEEGCVGGRVGGWAVTATAKTV